MASVRFICGTQTLHTSLEAAISDFLGTEATILYSSCFDANGGVFEVLFGAEDAIISDELNHASIIDGVRLSKAMRYRYKNADMTDLRAQLEAARAAGAQRTVVVTDGVFSMDGSYAPLDEICDLADEFGALVFVDDSHAVGFVGDGRPRHARALRRHGPRRHPHRAPSARPSAAPRVATSPVAPGDRRPAAAALASLPLQQLRGAVRRGGVAWRRSSSSSAPAEKRETLKANTALFHSLMTEAGFELLPGTHPIRPVMFPGEDGARRAAQIADHMLGNGVYVIAFSFPVVPRGKARIRVQLSAAHSEDDVRACVDAFVAARDAVR